MNDGKGVPTGISTSSDSKAAPPTSPVSSIDPVTAFSALSNPMRWRAILMMAGGRQITATDLATETKRDFDIASKHLHVLREAGLADSRTGDDHRLVCYFIPTDYLPEPDVVDYGFCRLRLR